MKKRSLFLVFLTGLSLLCLAVWVQAEGGRNGRPPLSNHPTDMALRRALTRSVLNTSNQAVFGPLSCTSFGDPWSPLVYTWPGSDGVPHSPTYHYRIRIPADYPFDIVRVELFDPDSFNQAGISATIAHTQVWIDAGYPPVETLSCPSGGPQQQQNACLIDTDEYQTLGLPIDQVNLWWFLRTDENRLGDGTGGNCGTPNPYNPTYNTQTLYELYYYEDTGGGTQIRHPLGNYTGQVNDGVRDNGDHQTDLRWVSPGGAMSYDQPAFVPVDADSPGTFEVSLSNDLIDVVVDENGNRYIYLDVTTTSGASENGFEIWAGPDIYTDSLSSDVNTRNVQLINIPASQQTYGIQVFVQDHMPLSSYFDNWLEIPLAEIGPEYAGQTISVALFDSDAGSNPPVVFYMDALAFTPDDSPNRYDETRTDWALAFAVNGVPDPDGGTGRCEPGTCNNRWISPTYQIQIPALTPACDPTNPDPEVCTPFYGGRLMAYYNGGLHDKYQWEVLTPEVPPPDTSAGCTAFPISPFWGIRSLTADNYPAAGDFDYPPSPPEYADFPENFPDIPLTEAREGYIYQLADQAGIGNFGWLLWNEGIAASTTTVENSLTWPGDSWDYTDHGDGGQPATPLYPHVVRGYVNPVDNLDLTMQQGDWVTAYSSVITATGVQQALETHIDLPGRILRLPVWNEVSGSGTNLRYQVAGFAIFKLIGYNLSQGSGWLLVEFIGWDESCGQQEQAPESVTISGPTVSSVGITTTFTAEILPLTTTTPITYTWQATDQSPITQTGGLEDQVSFTWVITGSKTITVTASNAFGTVTNTHTLSVEAEAFDLTIGGLTVLTQPPVANQPVDVQVVITNTGTADVTSQFFVDLFFDPPVVYSDHIPMEYSSGYAAVGSLMAGASRVLTVTAPAGFTGDGEHPVYAMVDSLQGIGEAVETNNITGPLTVTAESLPGAILGLSLQGSITGLVNETYTFTAEITPATATQPITYTWAATGQTPVTHTDGLTNSVSFAWITAGTYTITVTADNGIGTPVVTTHTMVIQAIQHRLYLPVVIKPGNQMVLRP